MIRELEQIKALLREEWDPIDVMPDWPPDEYDGYAFEIWKRLQSGHSADDIAEYLEWAAGKHMEVATDPVRERAVAEKAAAIMRNKLVEKPK